MLVEELAQEGPVVFHHESITLHCTNYEKKSIKLSLQCIGIKGTQVVEKWGLEIDIKNANPKVSWNFTKKIVNP